MEFQCRGTIEGTLDFGPYNRAKFQEFLKAHPGIRLKITAELPESGRLRRYFEGALVPLIAFYQDHAQELVAVARSNCGLFWRTSHCAI